MAEPFHGDDAGGPVYDAAPRRGWLTRSLTLAVAVIAVGGFSGVLLYAYNKGKEAGRTSVPPIIKAGPAPHKIRPVQPGGMVVPNRDKEIYSRMTGTAPVRRVERLLPAPETPVAPQPPPAAAREQPRSPDGRVTGAVNGAAGRERQPVPPAGAVKLPPPPVAKLPPRPAREIVIDRPAASSPPPAPVRGTTPTLQQGRLVAAVAPASGGNFRIQIASLRSGAVVRGEWRRLQRRHRDLLGELMLNIEVKDLGGGRGIYHRMQAGPLADAVVARALCAKLKSRNIGCIVVRR